jgi:hypothetical protein
MNLWTADASGLTNAAGPVNADDGNWTADGFIAAGVRQRNVTNPEFDARMSGYAVIIASALAAQFVPIADIQFGSHAEAVYNLEGQKSQTWSSVRASLPPVTIPYVVVGQQTYTDIGSVYVKPLTGHTPPIIPYQYAAPELRDLTQQAVLSQPWHGPQGPVPPYITAYPVDTSQLQAQYTPVQPKAGVGVLGSVVITTPQIEDRPSEVIRPSQVSGSTPAVPPYVQASQTDTSQLQPQYSPVATPAVLLTGILGRYQVTLPQIEDRPVEQTWFVQSGIEAAGALSSYQFGVHAEALYNAEALKSQVWPTVSAPALLTGAIVQYQSGEPQDWPWQEREQFYRITIAGSLPNIGPVPPYSFVTPQIDLNVNATRVSSSAFQTFTGIVLPYLSVLPQPDININYSVTWTPSVFSQPVIAPSLDPWPVHWPMPPVSQAQLKKYIEQQRRMANRRARQIAAQVRYDEELREDLRKALRREIPIEALKVTAKPLPKSEVNWEEVKYIAARLLEKPLKTVQALQAIQIEAPKIDPDEGDLGELNELQSLYAHDFYERLDALRRLIRKKLN